MAMDSETGEIVMQNFLTEYQYDVETGECVGIDTELEEEPRKNKNRKIKFSIPKSYLAEPPSVKKKCCLDTNENFTLTSKRRVIELKEVRNGFVS